MPTQGRRRNVYEIIGPRYILSHLLWALIVFALPEVAWAVCPGQASIDRSFNSAKNAHLIKRFDEVIRLLKPLLDQECITTRKLRQDSRFYLGMSYFSTGNDELAEKYLLQLLLEDPRITIGAGAAPSAAIAFIEKVRKKHEAEISKRLLELSPDFESTSLDVAWVEIEIVYSQLWINFLPFGAGPFQNDDDDWGLFFAITQASALSASLTGFIMVEAIRGDTFTFSEDEARQARTWQLVQIVGAGTFAALYLWGVGHGLLYYQATTRTEKPPSYVYPEEQAQHIPAKPPIEWHAFPLVGPTTLGMGVQVTW